MENRDFKGVWIPKEIWLNKDLTMLDKVLLTEISSLDNENHCTAGNEYFAEFCGVTERSITRSIQKLVELGYIEIVSFDGRHRVVKMSTQSRQNVYAAPTKCTANNIDSNTDSKGNIITINSNNTEEDNVDSHSYSKQELKDEFLGSMQKKQPKKRNSLYDKCIEEIREYTANIVLQETLIRYLSVRLAIKEKPLYGVNQWKGLLNRLANIEGDPIKVVEQSIEKGWCSFYPLREQSSTISNSVCSEFGGVYADKEKSKEEDIVTDEKF